MCKIINCIQSCDLSKKQLYAHFSNSTHVIHFLTEKFYVEPKKYALSLQLWIFQQRCNTYRSAVKHILFTGHILCTHVHIYSVCSMHLYEFNIHIHVLGQGVVLDRSAYSDSVFARVCTDQGYISEQGTSATTYILVHVHHYIIIFCTAAPLMLRLL